MKAINTKMKMVFIQLNIILLVLLSVHEVVFATNEGEAIVGTIHYFFTIFGALAIFIAVATTGLSLIFNRKSAEKRSQIMSRLPYIAIGSWIISGLSFITGYLVNIRNDMWQNVVQTIGDKSTEINYTPTEEKLNFIGNVIKNILDIIVNFIDTVAHLAGCKSLDKLFFENEIFSAREQYYLDSFYKVVATISAVIILIMVGKTAFNLILSSGDAHKRAIIKEDITRWFLVAIFIGSSPIFIKGIFEIATLLSKWFYSLYLQAFTQDAETFKTLVGQDAIQDKKAYEPILEQLKGKGAITQSIFTLFYVLLYFRINLIFIVRKITLAVMFVFTPIAIASWGVNKNVQTIKIWLGEMFTNAFMGFFFSFTFLAIMTIIKATDLTGIILSIVAMQMIITLANVLRNSFEGLFVNMAGVQEESMGIQALRPLTTVLSTTKRGIGSLSSAIQSNESNDKSEKYTSAKSATISSKIGSNNSIDNNIPTLEPISQKPENKEYNNYATRNNLLSSFSKNLKQYEGNSKFNKAGNFIKNTLGMERESNPLATGFANIVGTASHYIGNRNALNNAIRDTTISHMQNSEKYSPHFNILQEQIEKVNRKGKGKDFMIALSQGYDSAREFLMNTNGVIETEEEEALKEITSNYKIERSNVMEQLGFRQINTEDNNKIKKAINTIGNVVTGERVAFNMATGNNEKAGRILYQRQPGRNDFPLGNIKM